ncbi:MAG: DUF4350 domain-containing protein [Lentimicrobium sp.]
MRKYRMYIFMILIISMFWMLLEWLRPVKFNWEPSLINTDKNPYGTYIFFSETKEILGEDRIRVSRLPVFIQLKDLAMDSYNYLFIAQEVTLSDNDLEKLLEFVERGNQVLIASENISENILDSLGIRCEGNFEVFSRSDTNYRFCNPAIGKKVFSVPSMNHNSIVLTDSTKKISGLIEDMEKRMVMVKIWMGEGFVIVTTLPLMFSNWSVLQKETGDVPFRALSYFPAEKLFVWDEYLKQGRLGNSSPIRVILAERSLRWAYFLTLGGFLLILVFETRRRRSMVPVAEPLKNTSLDFVRVIAMLHFEQLNYSDIANKRILFLLERIRIHFNLSTHNTSYNFSELLSQKSGYSIQETENLIKHIHAVQGAKKISREELIQLNNSIESFILKTKLKI